MEIETARPPPIARKANRPGGRRPLEAGRARMRCGSRPSLSATFRILVLDCACPFRKTGDHPRVKPEGRLFRDMREGRSTGRVPGPRSKRVRAGDGMAIETSAFLHSSVDHGCTGDARRSYEAAKSSRDD